METVGNGKCDDKKHHNYECSICDYICCRKYELERHFLSKKHESRKMETMFPKNATFCDNCDEKYICECGIKYKTRSGLWKHKKTCKNETYCKDINKEESIQSIPNEELLKIIMTQVNNSKDMQELQMETQKMFIEFMKTQQNQQQEQKLILNNSTNINSNNNNNNKSFNLQIFLNEKCKDAMNITDFVEQIKGSIEDIESIGNLGFVEGVSKIFIRELKSLGVYNRPVHCTDVKRDNLYVKDGDKWEKENEEKAKMLKAIKNITKRNLVALPLWKKENPFYADSSSKQSDVYNRILMELVTDEKKSFDKVIKNVSKSIVIDKTEL
jgi:hypothetical protein